MQRKVMVATCAILLSGCAQLGHMGSSDNVAAKPQKAVVVKENFSATSSDSADVDDNNTVHAVSPSQLKAGAAINAGTPAPGATAIAPPPPPKPAESIPATSSAATSPGRGYAVTAPPPANFGAYSGNQGATAPAAAQDPKSDVSGFEQNVLSRKKAQQLDALRFDDSRISRVTAPLAMALLTDEDVKNDDSADSQDKKPTEKHDGAKNQNEHKQDKNRAEQPKDNSKSDARKKRDKELLKPKSERELPKPQPHIMKV